MSATVTEIRIQRADRIPSVVSEKIMKFLDERNTGQIILDVKGGRILGWKVSECGRINDHEIDRANSNGHD